MSRGGGRVQAQMTKHSNNVPGGTIFFQVEGPNAYFYGNIKHLRFFMVGGKGVPDALSPSGSAYG